MEEVPNSEVHEIPDTGGPSAQHVGPGTDQKNTMPVKRKATMKRKSSSLKDETRKKKKIQRVQRPNYTIQHGEDMLLIISNMSQFDSVWKPKKKRCKRKKAKAKTTSVRTKKEPTKPRVSKVTEVLVNVADLKESERALSFDWSQRMPVEVLVKIFEMVVLQDGAIPFLCR